MHYLIVPGYSNSGPTHWQTYWANNMPDASRVEQHDWEHPHKADWCVVASENDEYVTIERARMFAEAWGSMFFDVGRKGHINALSNLGEWEEGRALLKEFEKIL